MYRRRFLKTLSVFRVWHGTEIVQGGKTEICVQDTAGVFVLHDSKVGQDG